MNAKIEHRAPACFRSRREPLLSRRPGLGSAMRKARANGMGPANRPARDCILDRALDSAVALLHRDHQHPPSLRRRIGHPVRGGRSRRHRLFNEHVRARAERLNGKFAMQIVRRENTDRVGTLARQHLVEIGIDVRPACVVRPNRPRYALGLFSGAALYRDDLSVGDAPQRRNMRAFGNRTSARNRNLDHWDRRRSAVARFRGHCFPSARSGPVESSSHLTYGGEPRSAFSARTSGTS